MCDGGVCSDGEGEVQQFGKGAHPRRVRDGGDDLAAVFLVEGMHIG